MKKGLLLCLSIALSFGAMAQQVTENFPTGFRRAVVPSALKNTNIKVPYRKAVSDNGSAGANQFAPSYLRQAPHQVSVLNDVEDVVGCTFYDLQTNNSISNRIVANPNGTIGISYTFSPDAIQTSSPPFPNRGSGYSYYDGTTWSTVCPATRAEPSRTGFTNYVTTRNGSEFLIAHAADTGGTNKISVAMRTTMGTGVWAMTFPWGAAHDTWPKACSNNGGDTIYVVWQGSGAGATTADPAPVILGQSGPLFFARSLDAGMTWSPKTTIALIDSNYYSGFGGDCYSIDATESTVAISFGDTYTDVGLLKSTDAGQTWTKTIIQKHPIPFYSTCDCGTFYIPNAQDTTVDTVYSNAGDSKVLIDNITGMCHVWFSEFDYHDDDSTDTFYNPHDGTDNLLYWNENMGPDTGATRPFVSIATAQDYDGNNQIDVPADTFTTCTARVPWGDYGGGITQMPTAGIDDNGRIYMTYQTINESADTTFYHAAHRHIYMMTLAPDNGVYDATQWTYPYDIVPSIAQGGDGENQEGVFACTARRVDSQYAYVLYQRDNAPGHGLAADGTCDKAKNLGNSSDIILCKVDVNSVALGVGAPATNDLFVGQNYPNPTTGLTSINIGIKIASDVKVEVYDIIGKSVYSKSEGKLAAGNHTLTLNTAKLNAGIYTYSVIAGGQKVTRQMIVQ